MLKSSKKRREKKNKAKSLFHFSAPTSRIASSHEVPQQRTKGRVGGLQLVEGGQTETDGFLWGPPLHVVETADGGRVPAGGSQGVDRVRGNSDHLGGTVGRG